MIGHLKKMLGIDGLKVEIIGSDRYDYSKKLIDGELILHAKYDVAIEFIEIRLLEKYTRGRLAGKKTDEYVIGSIKTGFSINVQANKLITIPFKMPVDYLKSSMDKFGSRNFIFKSIARSAKILKGVNSKYRIEAEVSVQGSNLKPFAKKEIKVI